MSRRTFYSVILIVVVILGLIGVYAYTNPSTGIGHEINELGIPTNCVDGQVLSWNGTSLVCIASASGVLPTGCSSGNTIKYNLTSQSWSCSPSNAGALINTEYYVRTDGSACITGDSLIGVRNSSKWSLTNCGSSGVYTCYGSISAYLCQINQSNINRLY